MRTLEQNEINAVAGAGIIGDALIAAGTVVRIVNKPIGNGLIALGELANAND